MANAENTKYSILELKEPTASQLSDTVQLTAHSIDDIALQTLAGGNDPGHIVAFFRAVIQASARNGKLFVAIEDASQKIMGTAAWWGPGSERADPKPEKELWPDVAKFQADSVKMLEECVTAGPNGETNIPWYLNILAVDPSYQKLGIGRALIEEAQQQAHGADIMLHCSSQENIRIYTKLGFALKERIEIRGPYGEFEMSFMVLPSA
uniref:N-acetyltransferase domain-containing protein n=1 Tax=Moniliophthora roreri TaxID=221103 RepID=A0A0W0FLT8_MONRR